MICLQYKSVRCIWQGCEKRSQKLKLIFFHKKPLHFFISYAKYVILYRIHHNYLAASYFNLSSFGDGFVAFSRSSIPISSLCTDTLCSIGSVAPGSFHKEKVLCVQNTLSCFS